MGIRERDEPGGGEVRNENEEKQRKKIEKTKRRSFWHSGYILMAFELGTDTWMNAISKTPNHALVPTNWHRK